MGAQFPDAAATVLTAARTIRPSTDGEQGSHVHDERQKMRKVIVSTYATLDGRVDDIRDWAVPYNHDGAVKYHTDLLADSDGLLLGRKTYEIFAAVWPSLSGQFPYVDKMNSMAKYVASTTLGDLTWENSHLIEGDITDGVAKLKQQPGQDLVLYGCHDLMHSLLEHDLIDEYRILVHPVLLGKGRSILDDGAKRVNLDLVDTTVMSGGVSILAYQPVR
ncbi:MAG TPA: dihydrofolate reductase family protein [Streptosporangiaceae bacterium]|nr:dihydrofolate reductase family protein [Streptosporangiaceae bacterium]